MGHPKLPDYFGDISPTKAIFRKIFEGEMFITTLYTTLLQIFCEYFLDEKVISESITGPDKICQGDLQA